MTDREAALGALQDRLARAADSNDLAVLLTEDANRDAQAVMAIGDPEDPAVARALGWFHWMRYLVLPSTRDQDDLLAALRYLSRVRADDPDAVPEPVREFLGQQNLGKVTDRAISLVSTYERTEQQHLLEEAITLFRFAVEASPTDDPGRAGRLANLGFALQIKFERMGDAGLLDEAVEAARGAVEASRDDPGRAAWLANLESALQARFGQTGAEADLDAGIEVGWQVLVAVPDGHPGRTAALSNLGSALEARYGRSGDRADLEAAIEVLRQAVAATPADHPDRSRQLTCCAGLPAWRRPRWRPRRYRWRAGYGSRGPGHISSLVRGSTCEAASCTSRSGTPASSAAVTHVICTQSAKCLVVACLASEPREARRAKKTQRRRKALVLALPYDCRTWLTEYQILVRHDGISPGFHRASGRQGTTDNERVSERVRADGFGDPGPARDLADDPPCAMAVQPPPVGGEENGAVAAFAGGQVDRPGGAGCGRGDDLAALAGDRQGPVPALQAQVLDISAGGLRYPQPVQREQRDQRMLGRRAQPAATSRAPGSLRPSTVA
jgi:tetratricopeptide (TPR) repeat protein